VPALAVPLLALLAAAQLALPNAPADRPVARVARLALPRVPQAPALVEVPPVLLRRSLFSPGGGPLSSAMANAAPSDPLGGVRIAGSVRLGPTLRAVVQRPDGAIGYLPVGGRVGQWRLVGLDSQGARLAGPGGATLALPFGTRAAIAPPVPSSDDDQ
jgi:hypothetical protein